MGQETSERRKKPFQLARGIGKPPRRSDNAHLTNHSSSRPAVNAARVLSRVHRVRPELGAEVKFLTWTEDNLLRQVVYEGLREDKPPSEVRRPAPAVAPGKN